MNKVCKNFMYSVVSLSILCGASSPSHAAMEDDILKVIKTLSGKGSAVLCRKGSALTGVYSLRSFEGRLCSVPFIAAYAKMTCAGVGDFNGSQCDQKIEGALKGKTPEEVLSGAIKQGTSKARELVCANQAKVPTQVRSIAAKACPKAAG